MSLRSGVWTVLFTDLVGSTDQRTRLGDQVVDELCRQHDSMVARVTSACNGVVVKGTGDGAMVVFASAVDALAAAVGMQQGFERYNRGKGESLHVRIGLSLGELIEDDGDLRGLAANEAARVCAAAGDGEIWISDLVRAVTRSRTEGGLQDLGTFEFKGLAEPVQVWSVPWDPASAAESPPLPSLLVRPDTAPFTGRTAEQSQVAGWWKEAATGVRRVAFLVGEPGIGKTRLAAETARLAHDEGALVLYGRCDEEVRIPYQPFVEALEWYLERADPAILGRYPSDLARLSNRVADRASTLDAPLVGDPESEQHRLFEAVASWIAELAIEQPVVLVLDDVHWATRPTLLLLRHLVRADPDTRLLVVATYRDTEPDHGHLVLADLTRSPGVERVTLSGLDEADIALFVGRLGSEPTDEAMRTFVRRLTQDTEGNPFFIEAVLHHLDESGGWDGHRPLASLGLPQTVKEVIGQRVRRLGPEASDVLRAAAVVGRDFAVDTVVAASGFSEDATITALDAALDARLVEEIGPNHYRFVHALVRTALEDDQSLSRRLRIHHRIVEHLELAHPEDVIALAHHAVEAAGADEPSRAVEYAERAGDHALSQLAPDEAADWYQRALDIIDRAPTPDRVTRLHMLQRLGTAQAAVGDPTVYEPTWRLAIELADELNDDVAYAESIRGYVGRLETVVSLDPFVQAALEDAITRLPTNAEALRIQLLGALAGGISNYEPERATELSIRALEQARATGSSDALLDAIRVRLRCWFDPLAIAGRTQLTDEAEALAHASGNADYLAQAWQWRSVLALEQGDLAGVNQAVAAIEEANAELGLRYFHWAAKARRAAVALSTGDFDRADQLMLEAHEFESHGFSVLPMQFGVQRWLQGRTVELEQLLPESAVATDASAHVFVGLRANIAVEAGRIDEARTILAAANFEDAARFPLVTSFAGVAATRAAQVAGPGPWVRELQLILEPLAGRLAVANPAATSLGAIDGSLGVLAWLNGDISEADRLFASAIEQNRRLGLVPFEALALMDRADALADSEPETAVDVARQARDIAQRLGMARVLQRADRLTRYA